MLGAIAAGLALGAYLVPSLVFLVVVMTASVYVRRWGPPEFASGPVAFNGAFLGFFLREIALHDIGWLAADVVLGIGASLVNSRRGSSPSRRHAHEPGARAAHGRRSGRVT